MLATLDYLLLVALMLLSLSIGVYQCRTGGQQKTRAEFIHNNRQLRVLPTLLSFVVSYQSAISIMYAPAEYYRWGSQMWFGSELFACLAIFPVERLIVPLFYKLRVTSIYEYFELRFQSKAIRCLGSVYYVISSSIYMGASVLGPSIALETLTGLPVAGGIILMVGCCAFYTSLGGIRAVIWTDVVQCLIMVIGLCTLFIGASESLGGLDGAFQIGSQKGRLFFARYDIDPRNRVTLWSSLAHGFFSGFTLYGYAQSAMQRYTSMPNLGKARLLVLLLVPSVMLYISLCYFVGATVFAYFASLHCDPFEGGFIGSSNQLLPFYVNTFFHNASGVKGLFLALLYSASLSSVSSVLSGCAATMWEDLFQPCFQAVSEFKAALANKVLVFVSAGFIAGFSFLSVNLPGNLYQIISTLGGSVSGPMNGVFLLATFSSRVEWRGAIIGCITGSVFTALISLGSVYTESYSTPLQPLETYGCDTVIKTTFAIPSNHSSNATYVLIEDSRSFHGLQTTTIVSPNSTFSESEDSSSFYGIQNLFAVSWQWYSFIGMVTTIIVASLASEIFYLFKRSEKDRVNSAYLVNFSDMASCEGFSREAILDIKLPAFRKNKLDVSPEDENIEITLVSQKTENHEQKSSSAKHSE